MTGALHLFGPSVSEMEAWDAQGSNATIPTGLPFTAHDQRSYAKLQLRLNPRIIH